MLCQCRGMTDASGLFSITVCAAAAAHAAAHAKACMRALGQTKDILVAKSRPQKAPRQGCREQLSFKRVCRGGLQKPKTLSPLRASQRISAVEAMLQCRCSFEIQRPLKFTLTVWKAPEQFVSELSATEACACIVRSRAGPLHALTVQASISTLLLS